MVAAPLAGREAKAPARVGVARTGAAQVDHRGEILLLLERGVGNPLATERARNAAVQERGRQLDRVTGYDARVETVEPARSHVMPGAHLDHHVVVDAVALGLLERRVGDLVHADRARRRPVHRTRVPGWIPT